VSPTSEQYNVICIQLLLFFTIFLLCPEYPSCLQATLASTLSHESSQTVPHLLYRQTSMRPAFGRVPPTNLMPPSVQAM